MSCHWGPAAVLQIKQSQPENMSYLSEMRSPLPSLPHPQNRQARIALARLGTRSQSLLGQPGLLG